MGSSGRVTRFRCCINHIFLSTCITIKLPDVVLLNMVLTMLWDLSLCGTCPYVGPVKVCPEMSSGNGSTTFIFVLVQS